MCMSLRTIQAITCSNASQSSFRRAWFFLKDGTLSAQDEYDFAAVVVSMYSDGCTRYELTLEYPVRAVKEHVCGKFLFTTLEIGHYGDIHGFEINDHSLFFIMQK